MKQITIAGNIGKNAETRTTQAGDAVTSFNVAVEDRQAKVTLWFTCSMWGPRGEKLAPFLTKGSKVSVAGDLSTREHEGKTYLQVRVDQVTLMGGGQDRAEQSTAARLSDQAQRPPSQGAPMAAGRSDLDEDTIPFRMEWR